MYLQKNHAIQSAGMEDGLIDLIVIQLLVQMYKGRSARALPASENAGFGEWIKFDPAQPWYWGLDADAQ